ncbi:MAG: NAD(P)H-hydrate epimerase [Fuerstiella sp.]
MTEHFPTITVEEARIIDSVAVSTLGISSLMLMENAARGICECIKRSFSSAETVMIACGFGNNGGDGLALARLLAAEGIQPRTYLIDAGRSLSNDSAANRTLLTNCERPLILDPQGTAFQSDVQTANSQCLIVDCLLGTGITGNPRPPYADVINSINQSEARVLAVDVPSGLNAQTGSAGSPTVVADHTITFVGTKVGFETLSGQRQTGQVSVAPIGLPLYWTTKFLQQHRSQRPLT